MPTHELNSTRPLTPGTDVEVLVRYAGHWTRGFEVVLVNDDGFWLRRRSDGATLPAPFSDDEIRATR